MAAAETITEPSGIDPNVTAGQALSDHFDEAMAGIGLWEPAPHLTVAVSGGPDSVALCLLAHHWAMARGGRADAVTVDHGLRAEAFEEAAQTAVWMAKQGIDHRILKWTGVKPKNGVQEAARTARYAMLESHCQETGSLHLLVGHHNDDQLETVRMRAARRESGPGVAGMSAIVERRHCRILRPLLGQGKSKLTGYLREQGQSWVDDPSNQNPDFERARLRDGGLTTADQASWAERAQMAALDRHNQERHASEHLAALCRIHPTGFALINPLVVKLAHEALADLLSAVILTISGSTFPPGAAPLGDLARRVAKGIKEKATTLGGCWIGTVARDGERWLLVCRESGRCAPPVPVIDGPETMWDGRIAVHLQAVGASNLTVGALGKSGWNQISREIEKETADRLPLPARHSLPALYQCGELVAVPSLRFTKPLPPEWRLKMAYRPKRPVGGAGFWPATALAGGERSIV